MLTEAEQNGVFPFDEDKNVVKTVYGPGSNHENLEGAFDEASAVIWNGITELVGEAGISLDDVAFSLMGLAGIDHQFQHDIMCEKLSEKGLRNFAIYNDGFIVVQAGSESGAAIGYNCGTGTCCNAIDSKGNMLQLGGLSECTGDMGNGNWIAQTAFRLIYDEVYLGLEPTLITKMYYDAFGITSREEFVGTVAKLETEEAPLYIKTLIGSFFKAAAMGDAPALAKRTRWQSAARSSSRRLQSRWSLTVTRSRSFFPAQCTRSFRTMLISKSCTSMRSR